jgi:hypothetical protein
VVALVVFLALLFWFGVFMVYFTSQGTTPLEFLLGRHEPPPADLGQWREIDGAGADGLLREERYLLPQGRPNAGHLLHQVRYRDPRTRDIVRVEPEQRIRRRRTRAGAS